MSKIYQAHYKNAQGRLSKHHGTSLVKVEREARLTAQEVGHDVFVDSLEIGKVSLKLVISILNSECSFPRMPISLFRPTTEEGFLDKETGMYVRRRKVKKINCEGE